MTRSNTQVRKRQRSAQVDPEELAIDRRVPLAQTSAEESWALIAPVSDK
jgi:hypothetical protein